MALTTKHAQLLKANRGFLSILDERSVTTRLSIIAIALILGVGGSIKALQGTASDTVQICIRNKQILQCADKGKPYLMTKYHSEQWKKDGLPREVSFLNPIPATNPHKALWMLLSACSFGVASVGLRSLQNSERQLANYEAIAEKRDLAKGEIAARHELLDDYRGVAIAEVHLQADLEAAANDRVVILKQCEVLGEADIKIAQLDAEEAIFEAEVAGLSDDKKQEYMEFLRNQKTPFLLSGTQTLAGITDPSDKVSDQTASAIEPEQPEQADGPKIPRLTNYPAVLIYGPPGSGKTFFAEEEIKRRKEAGHKVTALDPHAGFNSWRDCEVVGAGMDYPTIDAELAEFASEVRRRYKRIRIEPNPQFQPWTFVCDEFTNWASRCKASGDFFQAALSDIRKAKMYVIFVSHARTLAGLGDAKGMAATRDAALLEIELLGKIDSETTEAVPRFEALVKLPGQSQSDRTLVKLVKYPESCATESAVVDGVPGVPISLSNKPLGTPRNVPQQDSEKAGTPDGARAERMKGMLAEILVGRSEIAVFAAESTLEQEEKLELTHLVIEQDLGIEKTIWLLWGIRRGGRNHHLYTEAKVMLQQLIDGHGC